MIDINFEEPAIPEEKLLLITTTELDDQYASLSESDQFNLFFVLLTTYDKYEKEKRRDLAAYTAYLISYYLFVSLTPPGSDSLALRYAEIAVNMNPMERYIEWQEFVKRGN